MITQIYDEFVKYERDIEKDTIFMILENNGMEDIGFVTPPPTPNSDAWKVNIYRDHFVCAPSQWETTLQYNVVSHWLGAYTKWSLQITFCCIDVTHSVFIFIFFSFVFSPD